MNESDYYKDEIVFKTLAGSQVVRNLRIPEGSVNNQMKRKGQHFGGDIILPDGNSPSDVSRLDVDYSQAYL